MNILITNDDGWGLPGIKTLESVASDFGDVWTMAPDKPMSGISHQLTFEQPMTLKEKAPRSYTLSGTPADCARVALTQLGVKFDWVLSGVNKGANLGVDVYVSGTVAAVREANLFGCRGIALSQYTKNFEQPYDWSKSLYLTKRVLTRLLVGPPSDFDWANVNFPDVDRQDLESVKEVQTELDLNPLPAQYERLDGDKIMFCGSYKNRQRTPGRDVDICFGGDVSITFH